jgi:hypothetical protein
LGWTWYINVDMQLFVVSLILLVIYVQNWRYSRLLSKILGTIVIFGTMVYVFVQCQIHEYQMLGSLGGDAQTQDDYSTKIYVKPWSRAAPYMLGLYVGIFFLSYQTASKAGYETWYIKLYKLRWVRIVSTVIGLFLIGLYVYAPYKLLNLLTTWTQLEHSLFLSTGHFGYTFGLFLVLMPMFLGYSNPIQTILEV